MDSVQAPSNTSGARVQATRTAVVAGHHRESGPASATDLPFQLHIILSCILAGIKRLAGFESLWLIRPVYTSDTAEAKPSSTLRSSVWIAALPYTAKLCQMALNRSSGTFAGEFALTAWLTGAELLLDLAYFSTRVVGHYDLHDGLSPLHMVNHALTLLMLYQAIKYPRVEQNVPDEDEE